MSKLKVCLCIGRHFSRLISRALLSFFMDKYIINIFIRSTLTIIFLQQFNIHLFLANTVKGTWVLFSLTYVRTGHMYLFTFCSQYAA